MTDVKKIDENENPKIEEKTILEQIPYEEFRRLLKKTLIEDKKLYDMLADA